MVYKVIQWGAGSIDPIAVRHFAENPTYELVGVYVPGKDEVDRDVGELVGIAPLGVLTSDDKEALLALDADVVNYAPLNADLDEVCTILRSGKNLAPPSEPQLAGPANRSASSTPMAPAMPAAPPILTTEALES